MFGTAYGLTTAALNIGSMVLFYAIGKMFSTSNGHSTVIVWICIAALCLLISGVWNMKQEESHEMKLEDLEEPMGDDTLEESF